MSFDVGSGRASGRSYGPPWIKDSRSSPIARKPGTVKARIRRDDVVTQEMTMSLFESANAEIPNESAAERAPLSRMQGWVRRSLPTAKS
jgi:hypothetical protein